jgi:hypothetical protein
MDTNSSTPNEAPANEPQLWYECLSSGFIDDLENTVHHLFEKHEGVCLMKSHYCVIKPVISQNQLIC